MPLGDVGVSVVDVRDIAEATAIVLTSDGEHHGKTYNLNGPEARKWCESSLYLGRSAREKDSIYRSQHGCV
jgi:hypothetical protein